MGVPKFSEENLPENLKLVDEVASLAKKKGIAVGQLALAWLRAQGDNVIQIPGTTSVKHLDNYLAALDVEVTEENIQKVDEIFHIDAVNGDRYVHSGMPHEGN